MNTTTTTASSYIFVGESDLSKIKDWREELLKNGKSSKYVRKTVKEWIAQLFDISYAKHICVVFNNDMFEYDPKGYHRHKNAGMKEMYEFDPLHKYLWIPIEYTFKAKDGILLEDYIEEVIKKSGQWTAKKYNIATNNSIHFVQACLDYAGIKNINLKEEGKEKRTNYRRHIHQHSKKTLRQKQPVNTPIVTY